MMSMGDVIDFIGFNAPKREQTADGAKPEEI